MTASVEPPVLEGSFTLYFTVTDVEGLIAEAEKIVAEEGNASGAESALELYRHHLQNECADAALLAFTLDVICGKSERVAPFCTFEYEQD